MIDIASALQPTAPTDLATRCYLGIREGILKRRFLPGERLVPEELAQAFRVSQMPVSLALKRLALEGLVEIQPRRGTVVARVTAKDVAELAEVRILLEVHAAAAAVARATPADIDAMRDLVVRLEEVFAEEASTPVFDAWSRANAQLHRFLVQLAGNDQLLTIYDRLHLDVRVLRVLGGSGMSPLRAFQDQHQAMLRALAARDGPALQDLVRLHIRQSTDRVLTTLQLVGGAL